MFTDAQLVLRVRNGEEWAFEELTARHVDVIESRMSTRYAPGESEDDIRQAALMGLFKAARTYIPGRGKSFRNWLGMCIQSELDTFLRAATRGKHQPLSESMRFEQTVLAGESREPVTFGELVPGPVANDPCAILIAREDFEGQVGVVSRCAAKERAAVAWRLNGGRFAAVNGRLSKQDKQHDNALKRVRAKLKAAA